MTGSNTRQPDSRHPTPSPPSRGAVFLDRDDTLNENDTLPDSAFPHTKGDLFLPEHVRLLPGVAHACERLADAGYALVVVTNQGGVARGGATIQQVEATNDRLRELLTVDGRCLIDAVYAAPHHPKAAVPEFRGEHPWRKPGPGMILAAAREQGLDLDRSWLVGDAERDVQAGAAAGLHANRCLRVGPECAFAGLDAAAAHILADDPPLPRGTGVPPVTSSLSPAPRPSEEAAHESVTPVPASAVTLRASDPLALTHPDVRRNVESVAHAIAERTGVALLALRVDDAGVHATIATHRLAATAFMAELRRTTNAWYAARHPGSTLWPEGGGRS